MNLLYSILFFLGCQNPQLDLDEAGRGPNIYVQMSQNFLIALQNGENTDAYVRQLGEIDLDELSAALSSSEEKLAFWINIYNALVQHRLVNTPSLFEDRGKFFTDPWVNIASVVMSFDDIEHGIIRNSRIKIGLGYLKRWFAPKWEKQLRNPKKEGRVHFALNCGAAACPPIAIYDHQQLEAQLDKSSKLYLKSLTIIENDVVKTSPLFSWFRGDFGGKAGIKRFLVDKGIVSTMEGKSLEFLPYDWTLSTGNYIVL